MVRFCNIGKDFGSITLIFGVAKTGAMDKMSHSDDSEVVDILITNVFNHPHAQHNHR